jgi:phosphatidylinositol glycan class N
MFPDEMNDWTGDPAEMDNWVFSRYAELLENATKDSDLEKRLRTEGAVVFLHLLGVDSAGHMYRPDGLGYLETMANADRGLRQVVELTEKYFPDGRTSYLITADHGMTARGSHGDGSPEETRSPIMVWGAGIRNCSEMGSSRVLYTSEEEARDQAQTWDLPLKSRQDVDQADVSPILASLIGVPIPMNSRGIVNLNIFSGSSELKAHVLHTNVRQLIQLMERTAAEVADRHMDALYWTYFDSDLPDPVLSARQMEEGLRSGDYDQVLRIGHAFTSHISRALRYYQTYDWPLLLLLVSLCYVLWVATTLSFISREESRRWDYSVTVLIPAACLLAVVCTVLGRVPVAYGCAVLISFMVAYLAKDSKWYNDPQKGFLLESLVLIEVLVMSYSYRAGLSALTLGMTVLRCARSTHSSIKLFTIAIVTAIFPLLPVDVGRHTSLAVAGCIACAAYSLYMPLTKSLVNIAQTIALLLMGVVIMFADSSVGRGNGLPIEAQISMWALSLLGVVSAYTARGVHTVVVGLLIPFCGMATAYESLFVVSFAVFLREWTVHADYTKKNSIPATAVSTQAFITIGFFGFGNLASVSSFDVGCVFRYVTLFNLPLMLTLLLIKIFIPLVIVVVEMARCPSLHGNYQRALPATFKLFCIVLCCGDAMSFHFFFMLKDTGSWKDIGLSISRFVICSAEVLMLLVLAVISGPLLHTAGKRNVI